MNKIIFFILFLKLTSGFSQTISGKVISESDNSIIQYANLVLLGRNIGVYSNDKGDFSFDITRFKNDTIKVSSVGFEPKYIPISALISTKEKTINIFLKEEVLQLDEVFLSSKKIKYSKNYTFGEKKEGDAGVSSLIGYETCVFIENENKIKGKIKSLYIKLKKRKNADFIATFNVKFYEYDSLNKRPGSLLYSDNIIVKPKNKKYKLTLPLKDRNIHMPSNGICVGIEFVDPNNSAAKYARIGPMYWFTYASKSTLTWSNYRNKEWRKGTVNFDYNNDNRIGNAMIGLNVLMPKK